VARAEAAIRRHLAGPRLIVGRPPLTPQAALSRLRALAEAGETPTPEQAAGLAEALQPRKRGRPPKPRTTSDPEAAAWAGLRALEDSDLAVFGAPFGPGYSRYAAVAFAMRRCGFRQCATSAAVANLARQWRRLLQDMRRLTDTLAQFAARAEAMRPLADAMVLSSAPTEDLRRLSAALSVSSALARVGAPLTLPRIATADFDRTINA
jgi:hypothetical protein